MNVSCPQCSTVYRVDPAKVPEGGVRARCSTCSGVIAVGVTASPVARRATPAQALESAFGSRPPVPGPFIPSHPRASTPARPTPARATPARPAPERPTPERPTPARVATPAANAPTLGASLPPLRTTPKSDWPSIATPPAPVPAPISVPAVTPAPPERAAEIPTASYSAQSSATAPASRRPINPFLARDPSLRAKRLARALVSDMVAYYPAKHSEGLEKGTLKELFRDEIKKSYDEYVAQVGADFARTTTHFQESLNEVLGAGKKIF